MSLFTKQIVSEKTLLTWLFMSVISSLVCELITVVIVYLIYGCWITYAHDLAGGECSADFNKTLVYAAPIVIGVIIGTLLTRKAIKDDSSQH